jgi:hypothetical protein
MQPASTLLHDAALTGILRSLPPETLTRDAFLVRDHNGITPLHLAAMSGYLEQVPASVLHDRAAMLTPSTRYEATPLHLAAQWGNLHQIPKELLADRAAMLTPDRGGTTPLHLAAYKGGLKLVPVSILHDATAMLLKDGDGDSVVDLVAMAEPHHLHQVPEAIRKANKAAKVSLAPHFLRELAELLEKFGATFEADEEGVHVLIDGVQSPGFKCAGDLRNLLDAAYAKPFSRPPLPVNDAALPVEQGTKLKTA